MPRVVFQYAFSSIYFFVDCAEIWKKGHKSPGVYYIEIPNDGQMTTVPVYCADDGWTVFQSRGQFGNPVDYFNRVWYDFEHGFGEPG